MGRGLDGYLIPVHWHCVVLKARRRCAVSNSAAGLDQFPVAMARGKHLFPFRTEPLSPSAPMVLGPQGPGRVGRRRFFTRKPRPWLSARAGLLFALGSGFAVAFAVAWRGRRGPPALRGGWVRDVVRGAVDGEERGACLPAPATPVRDARGGLQGPERVTPDRARSHRPRPTAGAAAPASSSRESERGLPQAPARASEAERAVPNLGRRMRCRQSRDRLVRTKDRRSVLQAGALTRLAAASAGRPRGPGLVATRRSGDRAGATPRGTRRSALS
ncbi:MAG: hypothetical protein QOK25_2726 [Thermoleophilaceae bacterium]|nr:hypothetical protein [Thermoleophilaceae bacterium]